MRCLTVGDIMGQMRKKIFLIIFLVAVCSLFIYSVSTTYRDYVIIRDSHTVAYGGVGPGGGAPDTVYADRGLRANPLAVYIYKELERNGTSAAKVYAINALKELAPNYVKKLTEKYRSSSESATTQSGCLLGRIRLCELFDDCG